MRHEPHRMTRDELGGAVACLAILVSFGFLLVGAAVVTWLVAR